MQEAKKGGKTSIFWFAAVGCFLQPHAPKYAFRHEIVRSNRKSISILREKKINGVSRLSLKGVSKNDTVFF